MKALVYHGPNDMRMEDVPTPQPAEGEVRLQIKAVGICGSDLHGYLGLTGRRTPPMMMGHEFTGVVETLGEGVNNLCIGERVACYPVSFCGHCDRCLNGEEHLCPERKQYGVLSCNGALAEYLCVPAKCCFPLANSTSLEVGTIVEPLAVSYRAVAKAGALTSKHVMVVGAGTIGLLTLACIVAQRPTSLTVVDLNETRLNVALKLGATHIIRSDVDDVPAQVRQITAGQGMDVTFEAVGASSAVALTISTLRAGGQAVWIGNNQPTVQINMQQVVTRELTVQGSFLYSYSEFSTVVKLLNDSALHVEPIVNRIEPFDKGCEIFSEMIHNPGTTLKCVLVQQ
ncbi:MAG: alcohol dehydrogenase catalytic domain-containing protein [Clostridia bacterium]